MRTPIHHPNINKSNGNICLPYIYHWENYFDVTGLIINVFDLLTHPNSHDAYCKLDEEKARKYTFNYAQNSDLDWNSDFNIRRWNLGW
jgi:ubiquitin-protein ligase